MVFIERFGHADCKSSIFTIFILFVENIYLLPEKLSTFTKTTISRHNKTMVKTSPFQDRIVAIIQKKKLKLIV